MLRILGLTIVAALAMAAALGFDSGTKAQTPLPWGAAGAHVMGG